MIYEYGWIVIAVILFGLWLYLVYRKKGLDAVLVEMREKAYMLMLTAERVFGKDEGHFKFAFVLDKVYIMLPRSLQLVLPKEQFAAIVQKWYDDAKDFLDNGIMDDSQ
jgi:hypothetical protein